MLEYDKDSSCIRNSIGTIELGINLPPDSWPEFLLVYDDEIIFMVVP